MTVFTKYLFLTTYLTVSLITQSQASEIIAQATAVDVSSQSRQRLNNSLITATYLGDREQVDNLLREGADVDATNIVNETPLIIAAENGSLAIARTLIYHNASIGARDNNGHTALSHAILSQRDRQGWNQTPNLNARNEEYSILIRILSTDSFSQI